MGAALRAIDSDVSRCGIPNKVLGTHIVVQEPRLTAVFAKTSERHVPALLFGGFLCPPLDAGIFIAIFKVYLTPHLMKKLRKMQ